MSRASQVPSILPASSPLEPLSLPLLFSQQVLQAQAREQAQ
jgi:hypothetical protein